MHLQSTIQHIQSWYRRQVPLTPAARRRAPRMASIRLEVLEERTLLSASPVQIRQALDLPDDVIVSYSGDTQSVQSRALSSTGGLLGFPSGRDSDFLMFSTGVASQIDTVANTSGSQGTDLGAYGVSGDTATISFTIDVPASPVTQKFKFDFMFLSDEYPEYVGSSYNDFFTATVNGTNVALDEFGNQVSVNNVFFTGASAGGTFFDGRTSQLTGSYTVAPGTTTLNVVLSIGDVGDGIYDSAVLLDNFRFEEPQVVYLDFDGGSLINHVGPGTILNLPAFQASDVKSTDTVESLASQIISGLETLYSDYDITFVTTQPASGEYMHVILGGTNDANVTTLNPLQIAALGGTSTTYRQIRNMSVGSLIFGQALSVDVGNLNRNDQAVIFTSNFQSFYTAEDSATILKRLIVTTAHEIGHNLGLRHLDNAFDDDVMKKNSPRSPDATFGTTLIDLAESWGDQATQQNDNAYLLAVLGPSGSGSSLAESFNLNSLFKTFIINLPVFNLFDGTISISNLGGNDGTDDDADTGPLVYQIGDITGGTVQVSIPNFISNPGVFISGSSTNGGPQNFFSGTPSNGNLNFDDAFIPLLDGNGNPKSQVNFTTGTPGSFKSAGTGSLFVSQFNNVTFLSGNKGTFIDTDGDEYTITMKGKGQVAIVQAPSQIAGRGSIEQLVFQNTDSTSAITVTVKKKSGGDGFVNIGAIEGGEMSLLNLKKSDIVGAGISITGHLGKLQIRDIKNGANISVTGAFDSLAARVVGDGSITAARIGTIKVVGDKVDSTVDFGADVTTTGSASQIGIQSFSVAGKILGSIIKTTGSVGTVKTTFFENSSLLVGFTPFSSSTPLGGGSFTSTTTLGSFTASGKGSLVAFKNSFVVGANIKKVALKSIPTGGQNDGVTFGVGYLTGKAPPVITVGTPAFKYVAGTTEALGNFRVSKL